MPGGQPTERGTLTGQLPFSALHVRENIFDGREENFEAWKHRLLRRLARLNLGHTLVRTPQEEVYVVNLEDATVSAENKAKFRKRLDDDMEALDEIVMAVNNDVLNRIIGVSYAKEAMDILIKAYQRVGTGALIAMRGRLQGLKDRRFENLGELFDVFDLVVREMDRMGAQLSSAEKIHSLLLAIPSAYDHVRGALTVLPHDELCRESIMEIKRTFLDAEIAAGEQDAVRKVRVSQSSVRNSH